ncbi:MAG: lysozyme inhibitor LprI family protein [Verrucomicrobiota bacterium]|nr:lysozyme inhibitor LprI family protein [Verrucomicrobiota bacterium]
MLPLRVAAAFLFISTIPLSVNAQTRSGVIPPDWVPALAPSIKSALNHLREANSQAEMNSLSRQVADMTDAQLLIAYVRLYDLLSATERAKLLEEQSRWLKERSKVARKGVESEGGSLAPLETNNAEVTYTEKRLGELRARLKTAEKKKKTAEE